MLTRILMVGDDAYAQILLLPALKACGYEVVGNRHRDPTSQKIAV